MTPCPNTPLYVYECEKDIIHVGFVFGHEKNFTVNNIVKTLEPISKRWIEVATLLELPDTIISSIQVSRLPNNLASLRKVVEWWFQNTANPEWNAIAVLQGEFCATHFLSMG